MAASMRQRLTKAAKAESRPFGDVLQYYALERWLFRLAQSPYRDRLILKGALLFVVWKTLATRPTRDIDFLGRLQNDLDSIRAVIAEICQVQVDDDGLVFDATTVATERIAEDADYHGVRATFQATLGNARIPMQIDIGFSDVITHAPVTVSYPTILDFPAANLLAYNRETAIAEKFEAMVSLGELNSRMKDFFDIAVLAASYDSKESRWLTRFAQRLPSDRRRLRLIRSASPMALRMLLPRPHNGKRSSGAARSPTRRSSHRWWNRSATFFSPSQCVSRMTHPWVSAGIAAGSGCESEAKICKVSQQTIIRCFDNGPG